MSLTTSLVDRAGCSVVAVAGELDLSTAEQLLETLTSAIGHRNASLILDLADLSFCDSAGLAVFVRTHNTLEGLGRRLVMARPAPTVSRILQLSGVDQAIATTRDLEEAYAIVDDL